MRRARLLASATVLLCTLAVSAACGDDAPASDGSDNVVTIDITFEGDSVSPNGDRVDVDAGQPIDLVVQADKPGEIHVHSTPEQSFPYKAGMTTIKMEISRPGVVEVESHELGQVIVQLEVR